MEIRYYCFNSECPVTELRLDSSVDAKVLVAKRPLFQLMNMTQTHNTNMKWQRLKTRNIDNYMVVLMKIWRA